VWVFGFMKACPFIAIAVFCAWINGELSPCLVILLRERERDLLMMLDPVNELYGLRGTIVIATIFSLLAPFGTDLSQKWGELAVFRVLLV
jgi:hypothetical protein